MFIIVLTGCKDSTLNVDSPVSNSSKIYIDKAMDGVTEINSVADVSIVEYDLQNGNFNTLIEKAAIASNINNATFVYYDYTKNYYYYDINSKTSTKIEDINPEYSVRFFLGNNDKVISIEEYEVSQGSYSRRIYIGNKSNRKENLILENADPAWQSIFGNNNYISLRIGKYIAILDIKNQKIIETTLRCISSEGQQTFSGSITKGLLTYANYVESSDFNQIMLLDVSTLNPIELTHSDTEKEKPIISPDDKRVCYTEFNTDNNNNGRIKCVDADGKNDIEICDLNRTVFTLNWIDNNHILVSTIEKENDFIPIMYKININTKEVVNLGDGYFFMPNSVDFN